MVGEDIKRILGSHLVSGISLLESKETKYLSTVPDVIVTSCIDLKIILSVVWAQSCLINGISSQSFIQTIICSTNISTRQFSQDKSIQIHCDLLYYRVKVKCTLWNVQGFWTADIRGLDPVMGEERMLYAWLSGQSCRSMEALDEHQVVDGILELLNHTLGNRFNISRPLSIMRCG